MRSKPFIPIASPQRILGMGDVLSLIDKVQQNIDQKTAEKMQEKLLGDDFTLEDFRDQIKQIRKLGPLERPARDDAADRPVERTQEC